MLSARIDSITVDLLWLSRRAVSLFGLREKYGVGFSKKIQVMIDSLNHSELEDIFFFCSGNFFPRTGCQICFIERDEQHSCHLLKATSDIIKQEVSSRQ